MMSESQKCLKCGGTDLRPGKFVGRFFPTVCNFRPEGGSGISYKMHTAGLKVAMCPDCGFLEMSGDPENLKAVIKRIEDG